MEVWEFQGVEWRRVPVGGKWMSLGWEIVVGVVEVGGGGGGGAFFFFFVMGMYAGNVGSVGGPSHVGEVPVGPEQVGEEEGGAAGPSQTGLVAAPGSVVAGPSQTGDSPPPEGGPAQTGEVDPGEVVEGGRGRFGVLVVVAVLVVVVVMAVVAVVAVVAVCVG